MNNSNKKSLLPQVINIQITWKRVKYRVANVRTVWKKVNKYIDKLLFPVTLSNSYLCYNARLFALVISPVDR